MYADAEYFIGWGQKGVSNVHLGALGNHPQGQRGIISADSLGFPDAEYFNGLDLAPATKRGRPCALWSHLQGYMGYQKIHKKCHIQNLLLVGTYLAPKPWAF